jgi:hypothetical protein
MPWMPNPIRIRKMMRIRPDPDTDPQDCFLGRLSFRLVLYLHHGGLLFGESNLYLNGWAGGCIAQQFPYRQHTFTRHMRPFTVFSSTADLPTHTRGRRTKLVGKASKEYHMASMKHPGTWRMARCKKEVRRYRDRELERKV